MLPAAASCQNPFLLILSSVNHGAGHQQAADSCSPFTGPRLALQAGWSPELPEEVLHETLKMTDRKQHFQTLIPNCKCLDKSKPVLQESCVFTVKIFIRSNKSCRCSALTLPDLLFRCLIGGTCIWKCCPKELSNPSKSSLIGPDKSRLKYATCCGISLEYMKYQKNPSHPCWSVKILLSMFLSKSKAFSSDKRQPEILR